MNLILLTVLLLGIWGIRPRRDDAHLSKEQTGAMNGFFVLLVFLRHTVDYITLGPWDGLFKTVNTQLDQLIVVPFLFYSGYGIMRSIRAKGQPYVAGIPWNRFFKVWYHFAVAVALYLILGLCLGKDYSPMRIALSFIGWDSIGNSNWYIFATLCMYLFTWLSFTLFRKNHTFAVALLAVLSVGYILILRQCKGIWWYDTALVYPAGALYGLYKEPIERFLRKKRFLPTLATVLCAAAFMLCFILQSSLIAREGMAVFFALTVLCTTMLFRFGNPVLTFLGKYTFEIYILQRIPMIILHDHFSNQYIYLAVAFCATLLLAVLFRKLLDCTDGWIYHRGGRTK